MVWYVMRWSDGRAGGSLAVSPKVGCCALRGYLQKVRGATVTKQTSLEAADLQPVDVVVTRCPLQRAVSAYQDIVVRRRNSVIVAGGPAVRTFAEAMQCLAAHRRAGGSWAAVDIHFRPQAHLMPPARRVVDLSQVAAMLGDERYAQERARQRHHAAQADWETYYTCPSTMALVRHLYAADVDLRRRRLATHPGRVN